VRRALLLLTLLSLLGCGPETELGVHFALTDAERADAETCRILWNAVLKSDHEFVWDDDGDPDVFILKQRHPTRAVDGNHSARPFVPALLRTSPELPSWQFLPVLCHEMGHAAGLRHTVDGVMSPDARSIEFTSSVLTECVRAGAC
jgi:hypothetical protein